MIKIFSIRKIIIASLLLLVALIIYNFPEELEENVIQKKYDNINIYLIDSNNYVAMTSIISKENDFDYKLRTIIDSLTIGSNNIPKGFSSIIPKDTKLIDYSLDKGILKINFSKHFFDVSIDDEERMLQSIIYSLTTLDEVDKIMIFVESEILDKLPNSHKRLDVYLDRSYGINKVVDIDKLTGSSCVTIYYSGDNNSYVPIS